MNLWRYTRTTHQLYVTVNIYKFSAALFSLSDECTTQKKNKDQRKRVAQKCVSPVEVSGEKKPSRDPWGREKGTRQNGSVRFSPCFLFFFFFLIRHAIHVPSLQHPRFNLGEVEGWILEGPGLLCVRVSNSKNVSRVVEETSCRGGLSENWSEGCSSWKEKVRKKKRIKGQGELKVFEQGTLYERNWWRDARTGE